jgi:hypothetical protein
MAARGKDRSAPPAAPFIANVEPATEQLKEPVLPHTEPAEPAPVQVKDPVMPFTGDDQQPQAAPKPVKKSAAKPDPDPT